VICTIIAIFFLVPGVVVGLHNSLIIGLVVAIPVPVILGVIVAIIFAYRYYKECTSTEARYHRVPTSDVEVTVNQAETYTPHWMTSQYDPHCSNVKSNGYENCSSSSGRAHKEAAADYVPAIKSFIV
jgi:hypothetical protein